MQRRTWLASGLAVGAAAAGAGWSWWRHQVADTPGAVGDPQIERLWASRFAQMPSGELALATLRGKPLVLNFWATWCPPCVKEMPELDRFAQAHAAQGWQVLGLAIDQGPAVQAFITKNPVRFPIALAGATGTQWVRDLGNPAGGLPFTVVFDTRGVVAHRKLGPTNFEELQAWAAHMGA
jgi:thiol-disulfide isomerase/thioredoxin